MAAASWGGSDFIGGLGARRAPALLVVASGHLITLIVLLAVCLGTHLAIPGKHDLVISAVGGFEAPWRWRCFTVRWLWALWAHCGAYRPAHRSGACSVFSYPRWPADAAHHRGWGWDWLPSG